MRNPENTDVLTAREFTGYAIASGVVAALIIHFVLPEPFELGRFLFAWLAAVVTVAVVGMVLNEVVFDG